MTPDPVSQSELRRTGLVVGSVALVLGGWWRYRAMLPSASIVALVAGVVLVACALVAPQLLARFHRYWMALGEAMGFVMTRVILLVVFALVVTPIGLVRRALGGDPLRRRRQPAQSYWEPYSPRQHDLRHYENMF